jgi:hypothetical protein
VADRQTHIKRALERDFEAIDSLIDEGASALADVMRASAAAEGATADTLGEVARRIATRESADIVAPYLTGDAPLDTFATAVDVLARIGDPAGQLQKFAASPEGETRRGLAVRGIGRTGDSKHIAAVKALAKAAEGDEEWVLLVDCIEALTRLGDHSLDERAAELLGSRKVEPKLRAASIMPYLFFPGLYDLLQTATKQRNAEIRRHAFEALQYLGTGVSAKELGKAVNDRDGLTREHARARFAALTGSEAEAPTEAAKVAAHLSDDVCHRDGNPIELGVVASKISETNLRPDVVRELHVITGQDFDFNPSRDSNDDAVVGRVEQWVAANGARFGRGKCYKFGHEQDLEELK